MSDSPQEHTSQQAPNASRLVPCSRAAQETSHQPAQCCLYLRVTLGLQAWPSPSRGVKPVGVGAPAFLEVPLFPFMEVLWQRQLE